MHFGKNNSKLMIFYKKKIIKKKTERRRAFKIKPVSWFYLVNFARKNGLIDHGLFYIITPFGQRAAYIVRKNPSNFESKIVGFFSELKNSEWQKILH